MKVYIGPYKEEDGERKEDIHIHDYDTWNMDDTLAMIVLPMLKQLKDTKHGAPFVDNEDRPERYQVEPPEIGKTDEYHFKSWDYVLDEMIFAFQAKVDGWEHQFYEDDTFDGVEDEEEEIFEFVGIGPAQLLLFPDEYGKIAEYERYEMKCTRPDRTDWGAYRQYAERVQNGFRLFGKYYQSLWD